MLYDSNLYKLIAQSEASDQHKSDYVAPVKACRFDEMARLSIADMFDVGGNRMLNANPLILTEHAFGQMLKKLAPAVYGRGTHKSLPSDYLAAIPKDLLGTILNRHVQAMNGTRWLVRSYNNFARAVLAHDYPGGANHYGDFENTQYLKIVQSFIEAEADKFPDLKVIRPHLTSDEMHIKISWRDVKPLRDDDSGSYGIGVYLGNSEIGSWRLSVFPFIQRTACTNSIIFSRDNGLEMIHRGSFSSMRVQFKAAIGRMLGAAAALLDKFIEAEHENIDDFSDVLDGLALKYGWMETVKTNVAIGTEGRQTRAGIINGITYAAHTAVEDPIQQIKMEMLGGTLLTMPTRELNAFATLARRRNAEMAVAN